MLKEKLRAEEKPRKKRRTADEIWEDLLNTPESDILLKLLSEQASKDYKEGRTTKGGFDDTLE